MVSLTFSPYSSPVTNDGKLGMMSGIGELNFSTDSEMSAPAGSENKPHHHQNKMPPPLLRPKIRRMMGGLTNTQQQQQLGGTVGGGGGGGLNLDNSNLTPPVKSLASTGRFSFGRLPRGALVFSSSNGKTEPVSAITQSNLANLSGLQTKLDFSPLAVLSPCTFNVSSPAPALAAGVAVTPGVGADQTPTSGAPLINTTNNVNEPPPHKLKTRMMAQNENVGSTPLKTALSAHSGQNQQNTPANNGSTSGGGGGGGVGVVSSVRRSSRLFGSSQNNQQQSNSIKSAKENTKTPTTATPSKTSRSTKSPSNKRSSKASSRLSSKNNNQNSSDGSNQAENATALQQQNEKNKLCSNNDSDVENLPRINVMTGSTTDSHGSVGGGQAHHAVVLSAEAQQMVGYQALSIQKQSMEGLMMLMRQIGSAYLEMSRFNNRKAIGLLDGLVGHQRNTGWILGLLGMAHFELGEYKEAQKLFRETRDHDPHRTDFMEYFSTALWHLQEEVDLSALAQDLTRIDKMAPQTWCAAGNCFSLQKEHENAIKFFQRAAQVEPVF